MKNICNNIKFHYTFYIIAFSFIITGYFKYLIIFTSIILIHELGHIITIKILKYNIDKITIYPFGGLIKRNDLINSNIKKEILISISGFILQSIYFYIIYVLFKLNYINNKTFELFKLYNTNILLLNILPIIPLDGCQLLNNILNIFMSYKKSLIYSVYISLITLIIILINLNKFNYCYVMLLGVIIINIYNYYKNIDYLFNKFLLERHLYKLGFKKVKIIKNKDEMMQEHIHIIKNKNNYLKENVFLHNLFD